MKVFEFEALKSQTKIDNDKLRGEVDELKNEINNASKLDQMDRLQKLLSELDSEKQLRITREAWDMLERLLNEL